MPVWLEKHKNKPSRFRNLTIIELPTESTEALAELVERNMNFQISIQDGEVSFSNESALVNITPMPLFP